MESALGTGTIDTKQPLATTNNRNATMHTTTHINTEFAHTAMHTQPRSREPTKTYLPLTRRQLHFGVAVVCNRVWLCGRVSAWGRRAVFSGVGLRDTAKKLRIVHSTFKRHSRRLSTAASTAAHAGLLSQGAVSVVLRTTRGTAQRHGALTATRLKWLSP